MRKAKYEMDPLKIKADVEICPPLIQVEYISNDDLLFETKVEDLIKDNTVSYLSNISLDT